MFRSMDVYEPVVMVEVSNNLQLDDGGLCNVPKEMQGKPTTEPALSASESIFPVDDLFELCGVCGMLEQGEASGDYTQFKSNTADADGWSGCNPAHPDNTPPKSSEEICTKQTEEKADDRLQEGDLFWWGQQKCKRFDATSEWLESCIAEFCVSEMSDVADMIMDIIDEEEHEEQEHETSGTSGLEGKVWSWDNFDERPVDERDGRNSPFGGCDLVTHKVNFDAPGAAGHFYDSAINYGSTSNSLESHWASKFQVESAESHTSWVHASQAFRDRYVVMWNGTLHVPRDGLYRFKTTADDAAMLYITKAGETEPAVTVNNNGLHGMRAVQSAPTELTAGEYVLDLQSCEATGDWGIVLQWQLPPVSPDINTFQEQSEGHYVEIEGAAITHVAE